MTDLIDARANVLLGLRRELVGPDPQGEPFDPSTGSLAEDSAWMPRRQADSGEEILTRDSPDRRYGIGVLYSRGGRTRGAEEVVAGEVPPGTPIVEDDPEVSSTQFQASAADALDNLSGEPPSNDLDLSGANEFRPTTMAVSFLADLPPGATITLAMSAGRYQERDVPVGGRTRSWWFRSPCSLAVTWAGDALASGTGRHSGATTSENLDGLDVQAFAVSRPRPGGTSLITIGVTNATPGATPNHFLFQVAFTVTVTGPDASELILPYPQAPHSVRDDEEESMDLLYRAVPTFAIGHGCAAGWDPGVHVDRCRQVRAEPLPAVETPSVTPQVFHDDGTELRVPMAPLAGLIDSEDGLDGLEAVVSLYEEWIAHRESEIPLLNSAHQATGRRHLQACREAAERMREGLELVAAPGPIREAFELANRAVLLQQVHTAGTTRELVYDDRAKTIHHSEPPRPADPLSPPAGRGAWRPFQIAFLLAALPSAAGREHPDRDLVDLIFFPTGGGKTEAYLGLSAFTVFLRRLRDPSDTGVEVLMRYTLRLLTAQQFQRAAALICAMESIRRGDSRLGGHPFSIGIWVGGDTTPNTRSRALTELRNLRAGRAPNPFLVIRCPWCAAQIGPLRDQQRKSRATRGGPRILGYDEAGGTVRISCTDTTCDFATGLPVLIIDEDIYEDRPDIIIGTVDKFAQFAWRSDARALFGLGPEGDHVVSPPGLIIQDELHLISGPLGSMVGLYETIIEEFATDRRGLEPVRPKIVASTATIRRYGEQVGALFARPRAALFPPHGLDAGDSFFARYARYPAGHERAGELREGRLYVGIHGGGLGSLQTAQVRTFTALLQAGQDLPETVRDPYWTLMVFFNSLRELGTSLSLLQSDIPDYMKVIRNRRGSTWDDVRRLNRELELTGRLQNDDIPAVMESLDAPYGSGKEVVDVCLASNIIEVGIDIDRLSLMAVVGQPKSTSQYIQVTGRVGRRWEQRPGLVATIYSPTKPRDRSHYEKFRSYHQRLYAQVEPTSVTPFAPPVLARALHAVVVAWVRQRLRDAESGTPYPVPADLIQEAAALLRQRVAAVDPEEIAAVDRFLEQRISEWERWLPGEWRRASATSEPGLLYAAGDYADPEERVRSWATPTSLRNVDAECRGVITGIYALATGTTP